MMANRFSRNEKLAMIVFISCMSLFVLSFIYSVFLAPVETRFVGNLNIRIINLNIMWFSIFMAGVTLNGMTLNGRIFGKNKFDEFESQMLLEANKYALYIWIVLIALLLFLTNYSENFKSHTIYQFVNFTEENLKSSQHFPDKLNYAINMFHTEVGIVFIYGIVFSIGSFAFSKFISRFAVWLKYR